MEEKETQSLTTQAVSHCNRCKEKLVSSSSSSLSSRIRRRKKFKGVVCQQNGHWGAQIYANHRRIWLGTFKTQEEAARAYDSAAIRVRKGDLDRNFPWTDQALAEEEPKFQSQFNTETLLNMIKDGSYVPQFVDYLRISTKLEQSMDTTTFTDFGGSRDFSCKKLFQKFLTPSDVSKLNRLVIPKKFAQLYFPRVSDDNNDGVDVTEMVFFDKAMKSWRFRFCYWKSSQSYVFTRGWSKFVKANGLKAKDRVIFSLCKCGGNRCRRGSGSRRYAMQAVNMIDVVRHHRDLNGDGEVPEKNTTTSSSSSSISKHSLLRTNSESSGFVMKLFGVSILS